MHDRVLVLALIDRLIFAFACIKAAEIELEPIDVVNGEYFVLDGKGNTLELSVEEKKTWWDELPTQGRSNDISSSLECATALSITTHDR